MIIYLKLALQIIDFKCQKMIIIIKNKKIAKPFSTALHFQLYDE